MIKSANLHLQILLRAVAHAQYVYVSGFQELKLSSWYFSSYTEKEPSPVLG
jgi:hypothetical protein